MELSKLDRFALTHNGLVTRRALKEVGIADRSWYRGVEQGLLDVVHPGVARLHGSARTPTQRIHAAVLAAGPAAVASHRSAAWLWGVPIGEPDVVDVIVPDRNLRPTVNGALVHRPRDLLDLSPSYRQRVPVTNILRTLCDLGALDPGAVTGALGHVVSTGLCSPAALEAAVRRHSRQGRAGVPALRDALGDWVLDGKPVDSVLEPAMRRLLAAHRLPPAEFHPRIGRYEPDFLITGSPLILECDGWSSHGLNRAQFEQDRTRDVDLVALGYVVLRFTYRAIVRRPRQEADRIRRAIQRWAPHLLAA